MERRLASAASAARIKVAVTLFRLTLAWDRLVSALKDVVEFRLFALVYFVEGLVQAFVAGMFLIQLQKVGLEVPEFAVLGSAVSLPWTLKLVFGPLVDWGRGFKLFGNHYKAWASVGALVTAGSLIALPFGEGWMILGLAGVISVGLALMDVGVDGLALTSVDAQKRSRVQSVMNFGLYLGFLIGYAPLLFGLDVSWRLTCFSLAATALIVTIVALRMRGTENLTEVSSRGFSWKAMIRVFTSSRKRWGLIFSFLAVGAAGATGLLSYNWMTYHLQYSAMEYALIVSASLLLAIVGGFVIKKRARKAPVFAAIIAVLLAAGLYLSIGLMGSLGLWKQDLVMYLVIPLTGIADGALFVAIFTLFMSLTDEENVATEFATYSVGYNFCRGLTPLIGGWIFTFFGGYEALFIGAGMLQLLALVPLVVLAWRHNQ
ncbi:MFS transporter [Candidatus Peregrinibacteria bacterium]|jgi:MFS family permease|nr:MFS transporter [Candidatus Peregrinibacteria bacterium]MBT7736408.1 MFS transporter [Candidatus Peregrinibacteria bacterium]